MHILRLTASLSVASLCVAIAPFWQPGPALSQSNFSTPGTSLQTPGVGAQTPGVGAQTPGVGAQTPGVGAQTPGVGVPSTTQSTTGQTSGSSPSSSQIINGQPVQTIPTATTGTTGTGTTGTTQTPLSGQSATTSTPQTVINGQPVQLAPSATGSTGTTQTPLNGQPSGTATSTPVNASGNPLPIGVISPPQIIPGTGVVAPPTQPTTNQPGINQSGANQSGINQSGVNQPGVNQPGVNQPVTTTTPLQPQTVPGAAATPTTIPTQASSTPFQNGQMSLDVALQQATCAQNWQQAIRVVNTAIAATPAGQTGYRSQLVAYRSRLQTLQAKGVQAPNWSQQCRGGAVANTSNR